GVRACERRAVQGRDGPEPGRAPAAEPLRAPERGAQPPLCRGRHVEPAEEHTRVVAHEVANRARERTQVGGPGGDRHQHAPATELLEVEVLLEGELALTQLHRRPSQALPRAGHWRRTLAHDATPASEDARICARAGTRAKRPRCARPASRSFWPWSSRPARNPHAQPHGLGPWRASIRRPPRPAPRSCAPAARSWTPRSRPRRPCASFILPPADSEAAASRSSTAPTAVTSPSTTARSLRPARRPSTSARRGSPSPRSSTEAGSPPACGPAAGCWTRPTSLATGHAGGGRSRARSAAGGS